MQLLNKFYLDFQTREAVKEGILSHLKKTTWSKACAGENTAGIKEAKEAVDSFFRELERTHTEKPKKTINSNR